ncbi:hypothetical protein BACT_1089 [Bifidobacterium actinocoloniiforme DSM 22766]|uniref:Uncharacterized protein n=1 Tax=Bifidobacterium actinocoloniiforme DSM 22766 TaxID=1437605 RepID=A0A086Z1I7_9BIFI|nr:hypothetical protein [Bifidobacterium actinocoloniiforme]AKV55525.1 hypothetical protein AB656_04060 [Bifidobacterium actinocoloniiforme DSM 22766]KFI40387.1 hypothetical protein BACT_1089 [Bifidobacterium actinocoloniiforme DSM 22766]
MSNEFVLGLVACGVVVVAAVVVGLVVQAARLAFDWLNSRIYKYRMIRTSRRPEMHYAEEAEERAKHCENLAKALFRAPKFRIITVCGWYIAICRDYKEDA